MIDKTKKPGRTDFWLIHSTGDGRVLTLDFGASLVVFSGEGEAELFRRWGMSGDGWEVRRASSGELASLLDGGCSEAASVLLDPSPEMFAGRMTALVSIRKDQFVKSILERFGRGPHRLAAIEGVR